MPLHLFAEPFPPSGALSGRGARRLLGAHSLTPIEVLVREAGQNAWDARREDADQVRMIFRLRRLDAAQASCLFDTILGERALAGGGIARIDAAKADEAPLVLEIADFGTCGLAGPTRADRAPVAGESRNFVNLVRNIGASEDENDRGGTYGYGKMATFLASRCSTVVIDSLAADQGGEIRRLVACQVDDPYDAEGSRYTGRHWWGVAETDGFAAPVEGAEGARIARNLGLPERPAGATGTTILVVHPGMTPDDAVTEIRRALLWWFWPKMIAVDGKPAMLFEIEVDGEPASVPAPETTPPIDIFVDAWRTLKGGGAEAKPISVKSYGLETGRYAIARGFSRPRDYLQKGPASAAAHHIALMRPVELVVTYLEGTALTTEEIEWGGVFICDDSPEVLAAFTAAEPPAHDGWSPETLVDRQFRIVNTTLRRLKTIAQETGRPSEPPPVGGEIQPQLAIPSRVLGRLLPEDPEADAPGRRSPPLGGGRRGWRVESPEFVGLEEVGEDIHALFEVQASNPGRSDIIVEARPGLFMEDRLTRETELPDGSRISGLGWFDAEGNQRADGADVVIGSGANETLIYRIRVPGLAAVGMAIRVKT